MAALRISGVPPVVPIGTISSARSPSTRPRKSTSSGAACEVVEADHDGREAQEAGRAAELVAERGHHRIRPRIEQPQDEQVEIGGAEAEGFW